ncbi:hypothetical protein [Massilia consociata]|uniref:RDD domain-containing protein n=1 Tax=Massilia consociata TaxID=760117 RepID=A0ABV6FGU8_9BURK
MPTLSLSTYYRITRASALFDIFFTAAFATPWTFTLFYEQLSNINVWMGGEPLPPFALVHVLITCLMGTLVMLWSFTRLGEPTLALGRYDGAGRFLFAAWMTWALLQGGLPLVWLFLIPELFWGVAQWLPVEGAPRPQPVQKPALTLVRVSR